MNYFVGGCVPTPSSKPRFLQAFVSSVVGNLSLLARHINGGKKLVTKTIEFTFIIKIMDFNLLTIGFQKNRTKSNSYLFIFHLKCTSLKAESKEKNPRWRLLIVAKRIQYGSKWNKRHATVNNNDCARYTRNGSFEYTQHTVCMFWLRIKKNNFLLLILKAAYSVTMKIFRKNVFFLNHL